MAIAFRLTVFFGWVVFFGAHVGAAGRAHAQDAAAESPIVVVLSWDGMRHDFPERADTPALDRMERDGARAKRLIPVFPSNTFPGHVSLATGTHVDRHGIVHNAFFEPGRGRYVYSKDASWIDAEPVWITAERQGVKAAAFFWVGSETDWQGSGATYRRTPFDADIPESEKVDQILAWLDLPDGERPGLIMSWWHGADSVAHAEGPDAPEIGVAVAGQDVELARLLAGIDARSLWSRLTVIVVADHGMAFIDQVIDPKEILDDAGIASRVTYASGAGYVFLEDTTELSRAVEVLGEVKGLEAHPSNAVPGLRVHRPGRTGDVVAITEPPYAIRENTWTVSLFLPVMRLFGGGRGMHGYRPDRPDMGAIFYALGRGVSGANKLAPVRAIDVAPTISELLGIDPPRDAEGKPVALAVGP